MNTTIDPKKTLPLSSETILEKSSQTFLQKLFNGRRYINPKIGEQDVAKIPEINATDVSPKSRWTKRAFLIGAASMGVLVTLGLLFKSKLFSTTITEKLKDPTVTNSDGSSTISTTSNTPIPVETPKPTPAPIIPKQNDSIDPIRVDNHNQELVFTPSVDEARESLTTDFLDEINNTSGKDAITRTSNLTNSSQTFFKPLMLVAGAIAGVGVILNLCRGKNKRIPLPVEVNNLPNGETKNTVINKNAEKMNEHYNSIMTTYLDLKDPYDDLINASYSKTGCEVNEDEITSEIKSWRLLRWLIESDAVNHQNFEKLLASFDKSINSVDNVETLKSFQNFTPNLEKLKNLENYNKTHQVDYINDKLMKTINVNIFKLNHQKYVLEISKYPNLINQDNEIDISQLDEHSTALDHLINPLTLLRYFIECCATYHDLTEKVFKLLNNSFGKGFKEQNDMLAFLNDFATGEESYDRFIVELVNTLKNILKISNQDSKDPNNQLPPQQPQQSQSNFDTQPPKIENNNLNNDIIDVKQLKNEL